MWGSRSLTKPWWGVWGARPAPFLPWGISHPYFSTFSNRSKLSLESGTKDRGLWPDHMYHCCRWEQTNGCETRCHLYFLNSFRQNVIEESSFFQVHYWTIMGACTTGLCRTSGKLQAIRNEWLDLCQRKGENIFQNWLMNTIWSFWWASLGHTDLLSSLVTVDCPMAILYNIKVKMGLMFREHSFPQEDFLVHIISP